ncbi:M14 family metallopeptidase [Roseateles sp. BYS180W]|uniref:M14 family metallopeptidase n=1 Tax=Roseateles rivi TaxID=3299028 RepID=A0ABW7FXU2_9BURK
MTRKAFSCNPGYCLAALLSLAAPALALAQASLPQPTIHGREAAPRQTMRAYFDDVRKARAIAHSRFETLASEYELGYVIVQLNEQEASELRAMGFRLVPDPHWMTQQLEQARKESEARARASQATATGIPNYSCYPTVEEVFTEAEGMAANKPQLASWIDIGDSWAKGAGQGGYDLRVLKLTNSAVSGDKPKLFINAGIHAREYTTTPLVLEFARKLYNGHGVDADATWILDHHEVHLLLATNPDGRKKAESGILWRKNTNTAYCGATSNYRGADLNRNFGFTWNISNGGGSSGNACSETYRGPSAASEPETRAVEAYIRSLWPDRRGPNRTDPAPLDTSGIHLDIHSHGRLLLWPWGSNGAPAGNDTQLATLGRKFAYWNRHTPQRSLDLYETDGTSDGPSYGELGVASFTFELGTAFFQQCSYYNSTVLPDNMPALMYAAKVVRTPYQTPAGPDVTALALNYKRVPQGRPATLVARVDDTRYNQTNGTEPTQTIAAAEAYIDVPPWLSGARAIPLSARDGSFDANNEYVVGQIDTTGLSVGQHLVYVRGQDAAGNWGAFSALFMQVDAPNRTALTSPQKEAQRR